MPSDAIQCKPLEVVVSDRGIERAIKTLKRKGMATVRVIARRGDARDKAKVIINVADCTQDPPFYPLSCEIGL